MGDAARPGLAVTVGGAPLELAATAVGNAWGYQGTVAIEAGGVRRAARVRLAVELLGELEPPHPPGSFDGRPEADVLRSLREAAIVRIQPNKRAGALSLRADLSGGVRANLKPRQINPQSDPRKEVAAYVLARCLGAGAVPPTVRRAVTRDELVARLPEEMAFFLPRLDAEALFDADGATRASLTGWVPDLVDPGLDGLEGMHRWWAALATGAAPAGDDPLLAQLSSLVLFDLLTNNFDRFSGDNLHASPDRRVLFFLDNGIGFQPDPAGHARCRGALARCGRFSRTMVDALRRLERAPLAAALAAEDSALDDAEIDAVLARRDAALAHVDALVAAHGADATLPFP